MSADHSLFHPGTCEATDFGKRYGQNLEPKCFDDPQHEWHLAQDKNWKPWSCCGKPASSPGCQRRKSPPPSLLRLGSDAVEIKEAKYLKFHGQDPKWRVIAEERNCWRLENGRIAKKKTQGITWDWIE